jgi:hypothetical protein
VVSRAVCQGAPLTPPTFKSDANTLVKPLSTKLQYWAHPVVIKESCAPVSTKAHYGVLHRGNKMGT